MKPLKPCRYNGCPELTSERYCEKHRKEIDGSYNKSSRPFKHLYNTSRWRRQREQYLIEHPFCEECKRNGVLTASAIVDHIKAHKGNEELFWKKSNWQALCKECHDRKTAKKDGRWGRKGIVYSYEWRK